MNRFSMISLITCVYSKDAIGQSVPLEIKTAVMCNVNSITSTEFFRAGNEGLKPELMFSIWDYEYNNAEEVEFNGTRYSVYRTFANKDGRIELYCQKKVGNNA